MIGFYEAGILEKESILVLPDRVLARKLAHKIGDLDPTHGVEVVWCPLP